MTHFHALTVKDIRRETPDCVSIAFEVPDHLAEQFSFKPGQNITLRSVVNGEEVRRSYSICSTPSENELRIAVKRLEDGRFSGFANSLLRKGDVVELLPPTGRFISHPASTASNHLAFAAGSGITPIISIIKATLQSEPQSQFTLVYGNRNRNSIIFKEQLEALKNRYMERFVLHHVLSREQTDTPVYSGRIDAAKCEELSKHLVNVREMDHVYLCGPERMIFTVRDWLLGKGVAKEKIHFELFTVPGEQAILRTESKKKSEQTSHVRLKLDGAIIHYDLPFDGSSLLDGALKQGADLPYACKGGVCATCRAKLVKGEVEMDVNYALEQDELDAGFILTCQSHPRSTEVEIDFDAKG